MADDTPAAVAGEAAEQQLGPEQVRQIKHAAQVLSQFLVVCHMLGFDGNVIVSAIGEMAAQYLGQATARREDGAARLEELMRVFTAALRARVGLVVEETKAADLARAVEEAKRATKH